MDRKGVLFWMLFLSFLAYMLGVYADTSYGSPAGTYGFTLGWFVVMMSFVSSIWVLLGYKFHRYTQTIILLGGLALSVVLGRGEGMATYAVIVIFFIWPLYMAAGGHEELRKIVV